MTSNIITDSTAASWLDGVNPQIHYVWQGRWKPGTIEPMRWLIDHEFVLFSEGTCEVDVSDRRLRCGQGTYLVIPPNTPHATRAVVGPVVRFCVHFDWTTTLPKPRTRLWSFATGTHNKKLARVAPEFVPKDLLHGSYERNAKMTLLMSELRHHWLSGGTNDRAMCRPLLLELLLRLFAPVSSALSPMTTPDIAAMIRRRLDGLPQGDHSRSIVDELESLGFSYAYLCRRFTARYGISPLRYVVHTRMEKAKALARAGNMKVAAIAAELGYEDVGYFIRTFRKYAGLTPREYARSGTHEPHVI